MGQYFVRLLVLTVCCVLFTILEAAKEARSFTLSPPPDFFLPENQTDICLNEPWFKNRDECLQILLEAYYEAHIAKLCPSLVHKVSDCSKCPWYRLNSTLVEKLKPNRSVLFRKDETVPDSCHLAKHAELYKEFENHKRSVEGYSFLGTVLMALAASLNTLNISGQVPRLVFKGYALPEPAFVFLVWTLFDTGLIVLARADDYLLVCESETSSLILYISRDIGYIWMILASFQRVWRVEASFGNPEARSWSKYVNSTCHEGFLKRKVCLAVYYTSVPLVLGALLVEGAAFDVELDICFAGTRDIQFGFVQYGKLIIETFALTVYSFGASPTRKKFWFRFAVLLFLAVVSFCLSILGFLFRTTSMTIPQVFDTSVAFNISEAFHTFSLVLLGTFEALRSGLPS